MMNGFNFSEHVRRVLTAARDESDRLHHGHVGTEHLLLGLLRAGGSIEAGAVLQNLGVDPREITSQLNAIVPSGRSTKELGPDRPYTSRAKKVLEFAMKEARELRHDHVGTEHLLLGILREEKGVAAQVLARAGLQIDAVRAETLRLIRDAHGRRPPGTATHVMMVATEVHFADGTVRREEFPGVESAMAFLRRL